MFIGKQQSPMSITLSQQKKQLVQVAAPAFLSKQAIEAQKSLEKLKAANKKWQLANDPIPITQSKQINTIETGSQKSDEEIINIYQDEPIKEDNLNQGEVNEEKHQQQQDDQNTFPQDNPNSNVQEEQEQNKVIGQVSLVASVETLQQQKKQISQSLAPKTYNKMTSEEADLAYQQRQNMIKTHIKKTKMAFKTNNTKDKSNQKKEDIGHLSDQKYSRKQKKQQLINEVDQQQKMNQNSNNEINPNKKKLLQDILKLDQEIQQEEEQLVQEQQKQIHRGNLLYQKGKNTNEKKKKIQHLTQAQKRKEEQKECTFKPKITKGPISRQTEQQEKVSGISCAQSSSFFSTKPASAKPKKQQNFQFQDYFTKESSKKPPELFPSQNKNCQSMDNKLNSITNMYQQLLDQASKIREQLNP